MKSFLAVTLLGTALIGGAASAQSTQPVGRAAPAAAAQPADAEMALKGNWRASKLMGLNVYHEANEKLGDINELLVDKRGKINAVVIGIGGFLGMGETRHRRVDGQAEVRRRAVRASSSGTSTTTRETTTGAASTTTMNRNANDRVPDHAVMSGNKEQLKALPQFKYSDYN